MTAPRMSMAGPDQGEEVLRLVGELLRELDGGAEFEGLDLDRIRRDWAAAAGRVAPFVARVEGGRPVGVLTLVESFAIYAGGNYGVIDECWVDPGWRSRGVGRLLLDAAGAHGRHRGDRKSTRLNSSHSRASRMPSSA